MGDTQEEGGREGKKWTEAAEHRGVCRTEEEIDSVLSQQNWRERAVHMGREKHIFSQQSEEWRV